MVPFVMIAVEGAGSLITAIAGYMAAYKVTSFGIKLAAFTILGYFMFTYSILGVVSILEYLENVVPHNMFSVLVYFGILDFMRISLALAIQTMMITYMVKFFFFNSKLF